MPGAVEVVECFVRVLLLFLDAGELSFQDGDGFFEAFQPFAPAGGPRGGPDVLGLCLGVRTDLDSEAEVRPRGHRGGRQRIVRCRGVVHDGDGGQNSLDGGRVHVLLVFDEQDIGQGASGGALSTGQRAQIGVGDLVVQCLVGQCSVGVQPGAEQAGCVQGAFHRSRVAVGDVIGEPYELPQRSARPLIAAGRA